VHAHLIESFVEFLDGESIVEVFGISRVNGTGPCIAEVLTLGNVLGCDLARDFLRGVLHVLWILIRQAVLCENGAHLGIVLSGLAQHVDDFANRILMVLVRPLDNLHEHLVVALSTLEFLLRNKDVLHEGTVLRDAEGNVAVHTQPADKSVLGTAENLYDLCFLDMFLAASHERNPYTVARECRHGVALSHKDRLVAAVGEERVLAVGLAHEGTLLHLSFGVEQISVLTFLGDEVVPRHLFHDVHGKHLQRVRVEMKRTEYVFQC